MAKTKRLRSPAGEAMPRIAIRLSKEMLSTLDGMGKISGRGTGEEIRRRIGESLAADVLPTESRSLLRAVREFCLSDLLRDWYRTPTVRDALLAAIAKAAGRIGSRAKAGSMPDDLVRLVEMIGNNPKGFGEWAADRMIDEIEGRGVRGLLSSAAKFSKKQRTK